MKLAIFGSSGRLGQEFCKFCINKNLDFVAFVRSKQAQDSISHICKSVILDDKQKILKINKQITCAINLTGSTNFSQPYSELYKANVQATKNILELVSTFPNVKKFIHISSIAVYSTEEKKVINESSLANPSTAYGKTKLEAEKEVLKFSKNFKVILLQPGIIYGPAFKEGFYKVLELIKKSQMPIIGDGKNHIPLVFYSDVLEAIHLSIIKDLKNQSKFILVQQPQLTQKELFQLAAKKLNAKEKFFYLPIFVAKLFSKMGLIKGINPDMIDQLTKDRLFDCTLANKFLDWKSKVSFEEGMNVVLREFFGKPTNKLL